MTGQFSNRTQAGQMLAEMLSDYAARSDAIVLAIPRGGVPVAYEVARALQLPLDCLVVRRLVVNGISQLAIGAIAAGGAEFRNEPVMVALELPPPEIEEIKGRARHELELREGLYRAGLPPPSLEGRTVILVDDGIASGSTMHAAVRAVRSRRAARIVVAAPIASDEAVQSLRAVTDDVVTVRTPQTVYAVGEYYHDFREPDEIDIRKLLGRPVGSDVRSHPPEQDSFLP